MRKSVWAATTLTLLALAGCASTDPDNPSAANARQPRQCFPADTARSFRVVDSRSLHVRAGRDVYRIDLLGSCRDLNFASNRMRLLTTSGSSTVCAGSGLGTSLVLRGATGQQRCAIQTITALTEEQVKALPARQRP